MLGMVRRFRLVTSVLMTVVIVLTTPTVWVSGPQDSAPKANLLFRISRWRR
jgi:hypothetical protein